MSEIRKLTALDSDIVKKYIYKDFFSCIELAKIYEKNGMKNKISDKNSGDYYGFFNDENILKGIFLFTNNKRFLLNFIDEDVIKKVDLLKLIKAYKPEYMSGVSGNIKLVWKVFERTVERYKYKDSYYMVLDREDKLLNNYEEDSNIISAITSKGKYINFLLEVEKYFNRNHLTINQLEQRIHNREDSENYLFYQIDGKIVSQAFVEDKVSAFYQIGGVYTVKEYRSRSFGYKLVKNLCESILDSGNIPVLAVLKDNLIAIHLYENLGFIKKRDYSIVEIEF